MNFVVVEVPVLFIVFLVLAAVATGESALTALGVVMPRVLLIASVVLVATLLIHSIYQASKLSGKRRATGALGLVISELTCATPALVAFWLIYTCIPQKQGIGAIFDQLGFIMEAAFILGIVGVCSYMVYLGVIDDASWKIERFLTGGEKEFDGWSYVPISLCSNAVEIGVLLFFSTGLFLVVLGGIWSFICGCAGALDSLLHTIGV